jgi:acetyl esterase/lipase
MSKGGGFIIPASRGHMKFQFSLQRTVSTSLRPGDDMSILSLHYTLAPGSPYPTQLSQAVSALNYLISTESRNPDSIIVGGDSAGGNLAAALLLHLAHPKPGVPELRLEGGLKLRAAVLISPWVSFDVEGESFRENRERDYVTIRSLTRARNAYLKGIGGGGKNDRDVRGVELELKGDMEKREEKRNVYAEPILALREWWRDVGERVVGNVLVWGGGNEVFIDEIRRFARVVREGFEMTGKEMENGSSQISEGELRVAEESGGKERVAFLVVPEKAHEEMMMEQLFFPKRKRNGAKEIENWLLDML